MSKGTKKVNVYEKKDRKYAILKDWGVSLIFAIIYATIIINFILYVGVVPSGSMEPTVESGDRILVVKFLRYFDWENRGLTYGDKVVFRHIEKGESRLLLKRVIALGGDTVSIDSGDVYVNGELQIEPYVVLKGTYTMKEIVVPEGEMFLLGDNRTKSYDSRYWDKQTIEVKYVEGEIF